MARMILYGDKPDALVLPCYGGPPVRFRLRGLGWVRFTVWMFRYQRVWHDQSLTFIDGDTGEAVERSKK